MPSQKSSDGGSEPRIENIQFCRLVRCPGLKQDHSELERDLRGSARVYSKVLVEENKNERTKAR